MAQTASPDEIRDAKDKSIYTVSRYGPERDAARDLAATVKQAEADGKRIILEIGGDW